MIAQLRAAQALEPHVVLAVEIFHLRIYFQHMARKFAVYHRICPVYLGEGLFKVDIHGIAGYPFTDGKRNDLALGKECAAEEPELVKMLKSTENGAVLGAD